MPRKPELSFDLKMWIWELATAVGKKPEVIFNQLDNKLEKLRKEGGFYEDTPDARTIKRVIEKDINELSVEFVMAKLPPYMWSLRQDYCELKRLVSKQKPAERLLPAEWREQLNCPPPELVLIDSLGRTGEDNSTALRRDILNVALEDLRFNVRVTQTTLHPSYAHTAGRIFWELPLDGSVKLLCPVERQPHFQELLASLIGDGRQTFSNWKFVGGRYLVACMRARKTIHDQAAARAGGLVTVHSQIGRNLALPRPPSHLSLEFGDSIYQLSIKCRHSLNILQLIEGLYDIRQTGLFCDLIFGSGEPLATGLRGEVERWIDLHQSMIKEFTQSEVISQLMELHKRILSLEAKLKMVLDKIIAEEP